MSIATIILAVLAGLLLIATALPYTRIIHGAVRIFEFPRLQMLVLAAILAIAAFVLVPDAGWRWGLVAAFLVVFAAQGFWVAKFSPLGRRQSQRYGGDPDGPNTISILSSNVKMSNRDYGRALAMARKADPDIALFMETDEGWADGLEPLRESHPHVVSRPYDNSYGMILFSRLPVDDVEVHFLAMEKVPSFIVTVTLRNGRPFRLYCVHPEPPVPNADSAGRDAELVKVARIVVDDGMPSIVCGDLNDVAWSHTTRLFQRLSNLLDPRVGRGFYNTFDARYPLLRWPLDHLFHDDHFSLVSMDRREHIGSDHFPILFKLALTTTPSAMDRPERANGDDEDEADDIVEDADRLDPLIGGVRPPLCGLTPRA